MRLLTAAADALAAAAGVSGPHVVQETADVGLVHQPLQQAVRVAAHRQTPGSQVTGRSESPATVSQCPGFGDERRCWGSVVVIWDITGIDTSLIGEVPP